MRAFNEDEKGETIVGYSVAIGLIAVVALGAAQGLGGKVSGIYGQAAALLPIPMAGETGTGSAVQEEEEDPPADPCPGFEYGANACLFTYTGQIETFTAPEDIASVSIVVIGGGASGGYTNSIGSITSGGGSGGIRISHNIPVSPEDQFQIYAGRGGMQFTSTEAPAYPEGQYTIRLSETYGEESWFGSPALYQAGGGQPGTSRLDDDRDFYLPNIGRGYGGTVSPSPSSDMISDGGAGSSPDGMAPGGGGGLQGSVAVDGSLNQQGYGVTYSYSPGSGFTYNFTGRGSGYGYGGKGGVRFLDGSMDYHGGGGDGMVLVGW